MRPVAVPSQSEELQEVSVLSKDAAEILWEMSVLGETGPSMQEMRDKAEQLRKQLRGLLNDYREGDETLLCGAFEAFDSLTAALDADPAEAAKSPSTMEEAAPQHPHKQQTPDATDTNPPNNDSHGTKKDENEGQAPLISFD